MCDTMNTQEEQNLQTAQQCFEILRQASSDNEKLAGLLLVPKLLTLDLERGMSKDGDTGLSEPSKLREFKKELLDAIGWSFLKKMLKAPANSPTDAESKQGYQLVALSVISCLCDEGVLSEEQVKAVIQCVVNILAQLKFPCDENQQKLVDSCLECLSNLSQNQITIVLENSVFGPVLRSGINASSKELLDHIVRVCMSTIKTRGIAWMSQATKVAACHCLMRSLKDTPAAEMDFHQCRTLTSLHVTIEPKSYTPEYTQIIHDVMKLLCDALKSKLPADKRQHVLVLLTALVQTRGIRELVNVVDNKAALLLIHLCSIEVRLSLESDNMQKIKDDGEILCSCFFALEQMIFYMSHDQDTLSLDSREILQVHSALHGAISAILYYINEFSQSEMSDNSVYPIVAACIRLLGAWTAEDTESILKKYNETLPAICVVCEKLMTECDSFKFLVPGLSNLTTDTIDTVTVMVENSKFLSRYIQYCSEQITQTKTEYEHVLINTCVVLLNCTMLPDIVLQTETITELINVVQESVKQILAVSENRECVLTVITCTITLIRKLYDLSKDDMESLRWLQNEDMVTFYRSIIDYTLQVTKDPPPEIWLMAIQIFNVLMGLNEQISNILTEEQQLKSANKLFEKHSSSVDIVYVMEKLIISMAKKSGAENLITATKPSVKSE